MNSNMQKMPWAQNFSPDFPVFSLLPILQSSILAVHANSKAPLALIASSALASAALACQGAIDVCRPNGMIGPVSLFFLSVANSSERKSTIDQYFTKSFREFEEIEEKKYSREVAGYFAKQYVWEQKSKTIFTSIKKAQKKGDCCDPLENDLTIHLSNQPVKPKPTQLIYNNTTPEALQLGLHENGVFAGIFSDEGAIFFEGRARAGLPVYNSIWSGSVINVNRISKESYSVKNARLSISLMVQERIFEKFMQQHGEAARANGFFSRCLATYPRSTQGTRFIQNQLPIEEPIQRFNEKILEILQSYSNRLNKLLVKFSPEAAIRWIEIYNEIEWLIGPGGFCSDIKDYAGKMAENLARIAAIFHHFEGETGDISIKTLNSAYDVLIWYTNEFKRLFAPVPELPQDQRDAIDLEFWLIHTIGAQGFRQIKKTDISKLCPFAIRTKGRLEPALNILSLQYKISFFEADQFACVPAIRKTTWVNLDNLFGGVVFSPKI